MTILAHMTQWAIFLFLDSFWRVILIFRFVRKFYTLSKCNFESNVLILVVNWCLSLEFCCVNSNVGWDQFGSKSIWFKFVMSVCDMGPISIWVLLSLWVIFRYGSIFCYGSIFRYGSDFDMGLDSIWVNCCSIWVWFWYGSWFDMSQLLFNMGLICRYETNLIDLRYESGLIGTWLICFWDWLSIWNLVILKWYFIFDMNPDMKHVVWMSIWGMIDWLDTWFNRHWLIVWLTSFDLLIARLFRIDVYDRMISMYWYRSGEI